jgi:hypothetical protein
LPLPSVLSVLLSKKSYRKSSDPVESLAGVTVSFKDKGIGTATNERATITFARQWRPIIIHFHSTCDYEEQCDLQIQSM